MSIRKKYEDLGVAYYYKNYGHSYENPHEKELQELLRRNAEKMPLEKVLDFAAGGGEVTRCLQALGHSSIQGCDPYTYALYEKQTGLPCWRFSFEEVLKKGLPERFSCIIASFALHLCPEEQLYGLAMQLFAAAPQLTVITPHKRPALEQYEGIELLWEDAVYTEKGKAVRLKSYGSWEWRALLEAQDKA